MVIHTQAAVFFLWLCLFFLFFQNIYCVGYIFCLSGTTNSKKYLKLLLYTIGIVAGVVTFYAFWFFFLRRVLPLFFKIGGITIAALKGLGAAGCKNNIVFGKIWAFIYLYPSSILIFSVILVILFIQLQLFLRNNNLKKNKLFCAITQKTKFTIEYGIFTIINAVWAFTLGILIFMEALKFTHKAIARLNSKRQIFGSYITDGHIMTIVNNMDFLVLLIYFSIFFYILAYSEGNVNFPNDIYIMLQWGNQFLVWNWFGLLSVILWKMYYFSEWAALLTILVKSGSYLKFAYAVAFHIAEACFLEEITFAVCILFGILRLLCNFGKKLANIKMTTYIIICKFLREIGLLLAIPLLKLTTGSIITLFKLATVKLLVPVIPTIQIYIVAILLTAMVIALIFLLLHLIDIYIFEHYTCWHKLTRTKKFIKIAIFVYCALADTLYILILL